VGALGLLRSRAALAREPARAAGIPGVTGRVVRRTDADYESWRQALVWHRSKPARYPDLIVQPASADEVAAVVRHAAEKRLKIAVRSGGHNPTGPSVRDGGICLDLSGLTGIEVDAARQRVSIGTGVRAIQLVSALAGHGLTFPTAHCASVGMGGFLLGGGLGWNHPYRGGVATFNIAGAELVLADGRRVRATPDENSELLWAVRGAGPGLFAAVTRFELEAYPLPKAILASSYILPLEALETMTSTLGALSSRTDRRLEILALLMHDPEAAPDARPEDSKICFVTAFAFGDSDAESRAMLEPLATSALARESVARDENHPYTFMELFPTFFSTATPGGYMGRYAAESAITDEPGKILHGLAPHFRTAASPVCHVIASYGLDLKARPDACFSSIARHYVGCFAIWDDEKEDEHYFRWLEQATTYMDPHAKGHYINEVEARRHPERIRKCFSEANWQRLQALRRQYDPQGVFHTWLGQPA
jgi:FAD/FMN-containing dehydrogenase